MEKNINCYEKYVGTLLDGKYQIEKCLGVGGMAAVLLAKDVEKNIRVAMAQSRVRSVAELAKRSVEMNELAGSLAKDRISIINGDIMKATEYFSSRCFDAIVTNPPYKRRGAGILNDSSRLNIARHEISCTLSDIIEKASYLLKNGGDFMMVNHTERLADAIEEMRKHRIEPKNLQFVFSDITAKPVLFLVHGVLFGGKNLIIEKGIEVK